MDYFISKLFDDVIYRLNNNELERYDGKGKWTKVNGMLRDFKTGANTDIMGITPDEAKAKISLIDDLTPAT